MEEEYIVTQNGLTCWHLDKTPFTEEVAKKAELELNEKPEGVAKAIETLRETIIENGDFTSRLDVDFLLRFLRARKFDCKRAYKLIRNYYSCLSKYESIFEDIRPSSIQDLIFRNAFTVLPYRDPEGRAIVILRLGEMTPERTPFHITVRIIAMSLETIVQNPVSQVHGVVAIIDFRDIGFRFFSYVTTPTNLHTIFVLLQDCFPGRVKEKHMIFGYRFIKIAYEAAKFFMNAKMRSRFVFHGDNCESLRKYIPPEILPEEYGGTLQLDRTMWPNRLLSMEEVFKETKRQALTKKQSFE